MYKIKSTQVDGTNFGVEVEYTLNDGTIIDAHIDVFMPKSKDDVILAIESRKETEEVKINATILNETIKIEIDKDIADNIL